jgi:hypothetical protein
MPNTYTKIQSLTVTGNTQPANQSFNSIPQTYTDLVLECSVRMNGSGFYDNVLLTFNGSSAGYYMVRSTQAYSDTWTNTSFFYIGEITGNGAATANSFGYLRIYIPNYATSNFKSVYADHAVENNSTSHYMGMRSGYWANTAAITSITLSGNGFMDYSSLTLYGIKNT